MRRVLTLQRDLYHLAMNHYEALGVDATASAAQLRSAYLQLARQHHPDFQQSNGGPSSQKPVADSEFRMRQINAAWQANGEKRCCASMDPASVPQNASLPEWYITSQG